MSLNDTVFIDGFGKTYINCSKVTPGEKLTVCLCDLSGDHKQPGLASEGPSSKDWLGFNGEPQAPCLC